MAATDSLQEITKKCTISVQKVRSLIIRRTGTSKMNTFLGQRILFFSLPPFFTCLRKADRSQNRVLTAPWLTAYSRPKSQWQGCVPYIPCASERNNNTTKKRFHMLCVCSLALFSFSSRSRTNTLSKGKAGDTAERPLGSNRALEEDSVEQTRIARVLYLF